MCGANLKSSLAGSGEQGEPATLVQSAEFDIDKRHFPYFTIDKELTLASGTRMFIQSKMQGKPIDTSDLVLVVNGSNANTWSNFRESENMKESPFSISGSPIRKWTIEVSSGELEREKVEDVMILMRYNTS